MSQVTENKVVAAPVPMTPLQEFWHYFKRNKGAVVGLVYVAIMILIAVFANFLAPYNPADQFRDALLAPPAGRMAVAWRTCWVPMTWAAICCRV
jgi:dipeptide transport system permease protein